MLMQVERWTVQDMTLTPEKIKQVWKMLKRQRTLFSDLTTNDVSNFVNVITAPNSIWFEVREHGAIVGLVFFSDLHQIVDCTAHMVFFDRNIMEKQKVCVMLIQWMFREFPLQRMSVTPPRLYKKTIHLLKTIGFQQEGLKRRASLIGGRWWDQAMFGLTRAEAEAL